MEFLFEPKRAIKQSGGSLASFMLFGLSNAGGFQLAVESMQGEYQALELFNFLLCPS
jgi:hypothetical protein